MGEAKRAERSLRSMHWNEALHPRDNDGKFARKGGTKWATKLLKQMGERADMSMGAHPDHPHATGGQHVGTGAGQTHVSALVKAAGERYPRKPNAPKAPEPATHGGRMPGGHAPAAPESSESFMARQSAKHAAAKASGRMPGGGTPAGEKKPSVHTIMKSEGIPRPHDHGAQEAVANADHRLSRGGNPAEVASYLREHAKSLEVSRGELPDSRQTLDDEEYAGLSQSARSLRRAADAVERSGGDVTPNAGRMPGGTAAPASLSHDERQAANLRDQFGALSPAQRERKLATLRKQLEGARGQEGIARDKRRVSGSRLASQAETRARAKQSDLRRQISVLEGLGSGEGQHPKA